MLFHAVQGACGALLIPQGFTLLLKVFPRSDLGRVFGLFGPLMAVSSISGPELAGLIIALSPSPWAMSPNPRREALAAPSAAPSNSSTRPERR